MSCVSDRLRAEIKTCGMTRAELARRSGVPESVLSRFTVHGRDLRSDNLDRLCKVLGLKLVGKAMRPAVKRKATNGKRDS